MNKEKKKTGATPKKKGRTRKIKRPMRGFNVKYDKAKAQYYILLGDSPYYIKKGFNPSSKTALKSLQKAVTVIRNEQLAERRRIKRRGGRFHLRISDKKLRGLYTPSGFYEDPYGKGRYNPSAITHILQHPENFPPTIPFVREGGQMFRMQEYFRGSGRGVTTDLDLIKILSVDKKFHGVCMRDQIQHCIEVGLQKKDVFGFIANSDVTDGKGIHWWALYIDPFRKKQVGFYDSYGEPAPKDVKEQVKRAIEKFKVPHMVKFKENRRVHQDDHEETCGYHAANFLLQMFENNGNFVASTNHSKKSQKAFVKEMMNQYEEFGYV